MIARMQQPAPLRTHADLAEMLNLAVSTVVELRKREGWPHVRLGRAVRFTDDQIAEIITSHTRSGVADDRESRIQTLMRDTGLTRRSAARMA